MNTRAFSTTVASKGLRIFGRSIRSRRGFPVRQTTTVEAPFLAGAQQNSQNVRILRRKSASVAGNQIMSALVTDSPTELPAKYKPEGWQKAGVVGQSVAIAIAATSTAVVFDKDHFPPALRLFILSYALASTAEWWFHKYDMHETDAVHILHHGETNPDMTMPEGYDINAIQFPLSASAKIAALGFPLLSIADVFLRLEIPIWYNAVAAVLVAGIHAGLWNTMHPDSHEIVLNPNDRMSDSNGASYLEWLPTDNFIWRWLILNHTGHHTIKGNYNCVYPGADNVYGTFFFTKKEEQ